MHVPVLAYHAVNISGNGYASNDLLAFAADLRLIDDLGLRIVPLQWVVDQVIGEADLDLNGCVALTCDDGTDLDFRDVEFSTFGLQRGLYHCLLDFIAERGREAQPHLHLTSFVIASPEARQQIDKQCLSGEGWMNDDWWHAASNSELMAIENHSWDHNHPALSMPGVDSMPRGSFLEVNNEIRARQEIAEATNFINRLVSPKRTRIFCYPFSEVPAYVHDEYLPQFGRDHGIVAAMGGDPLNVTADADRWNLPRYICGFHWKTPENLKDILVPR